MSAITTMIRVRLLWGTTLLAVAARPPERPDRDRRTRAILVLLAARNLLQAALTGRRPSGSVLAAGAATDLVHGLSMAALAVASPRWRRRAAGDAVVASAFAAVGVKAARERAHPGRYPRNRRTRFRGPARTV
jgi:hypothetical protein